MGFSSASLFLERKQEAVFHGGTKGIDHRTRRRKGKTEKHREVKVKRNLGFLVQPPYSPQIDGRQSLEVETTGIDHPTRRITLGTGIVKGWEVTPDAFTQKKNNTSTAP